jgi:hypothetical protein
MQRAKGKALSVNQRMLLKGFLLPAPCAMQEGTDPLPRSGGLAFRSAARMNNSGWIHHVRFPLLTDKSVFDYVPHNFDCLPANPRLLCRGPTKAPAEVKQ